MYPNALLDVFRCTGLQPASLFCETPTISPHVGVFLALLCTGMLFEISSEEEFPTGCSQGNSDAAKICIGDFSSSTASLMQCSGDGTGVIFWPGSANCSRAFLIQFPTNTNVGGCHCIMLVLLALQQGQRQYQSQGLLVLGMQSKQRDADCRPSEVSTPEYAHSCSLVKTHLLSGYIPPVRKLQRDKRTTALFVGKLLEHLPQLLLEWKAFCYHRAATADFFSKYRAEKRIECFRSSFSIGDVSTFFPQQQVKLIAGVAAPENP